MKRKSYSSSLFVMTGEDERREGGREEGREGGRQAEVKHIMQYSSQAILWLCDVVNSTDLPH